MAIGQDHQISAQARGERFDQDMHLLGLASSACGISYYPTHGISGGYRGKCFARLKCDIADFLGGRVKPIERVLGIGIDLRGIDVIAAGGFAQGPPVGGLHPFDRRHIRRGFGIDRKDRSEDGAGRDWSRWRWRRRIFLCHGRFECRRVIMKQRWWRYPRAGAEGRAQ